MTSEYMIFTDSGIDLPLELQDGSVCVIPMNYLLNDEARVFDGAAPREDFCERFYETLRARDTTVSTSQITPFAFEEAFRPILEAGKDVLYVGFSGGLSSTFKVAQSTALQLGQAYPNRKILCVDSLSAAPGLGIALLAACRNRKAGMDLEDNAKALTELAPLICHWFVVDSLDFLKRGGRVSPAVAFVGDKLNLKPILDIAPDGTLKVISKARGMNAAMRYMVHQMLESLPKDGTPEVFIAHAGAAEKAGELAGLVQNAAPHVKVELTCLSPIIGAHTGPGMMAICYAGTKVHRPC